MANDHRPSLRKSHRPGLETLEARAMLHASRLGLVVPATVQAGQFVDVMVTAYHDATVETGYRGTVHFSSSDTAAGLPANYTFTAADNGVHHFQLRLQTAGTPSVLVTDTANGSLQGSATATVATSDLMRFELQVPETIVAGVETDVTVVAVDAGGNRIMDYEGTVKFKTTDVLAKPPEKHVFTSAEQGTFTTKLTLYTAGPHTVSVFGPDEENQDLEPEDCGCGDLVRGTDRVTVEPGDLATFEVLGGERVVVGEEMEIAVVAEDRYGNVVDDFTGDVHIMTTDGEAELPSEVTFTEEDEGAVLVPIKYLSIGDYTLIAQAAEGQTFGVSDVAVRYATASQNYVHTVYTELLGRPADDVGLAYWSSQLDQGAGREVVLTSIEGSAEFRTLYVQGLFLGLLGREADQAGLDYFTGQMAVGASVDQVAASLMSSGEYLEMSGGTAESYVTMLYLDLLNREADEAGLAHFSQMLNTGTPKSEVVRQMMGSAEAYQALTNDAFGYFLERQPDGAAQEHFVAAGANGMHTEELLNAVLASDEYFVMVS